MKKVLYLFIFYLPIAYTQSTDSTLEQILVSDKLISGLNDVKNNVKNECRDQNESTSDIDNVIQIEFTPIVTFSAQSFSGVKLKRSTEFLNSNRSDFNSKWIALITPTNAQDRSLAIKDICNDMTQRDAIEFAGYIGDKTLQIYDQRRTSSSQSDKVNEHISLDSLYQVLRNNEGLGDSQGRRKMGVCGDTAVLVANFLSQCGFKCSDIDIASYKTIGSGHKMVTARGSNGEFYTANWSEVKSTTNTNPLNYSTAEPYITNLGAYQRLHDCNGSSKGSTTTPLGTLLMLAHEQDRVINDGQTFNQLKVIAKKWGANEISIKAFSGQDNESNQRLDGVGVKVNFDLTKKDSFIKVNLENSTVLAKAQREIVRFENEDSTSINQDILSNRVAVKTQANFNLMQTSIKP